MPYIPVSKRAGGAPTTTTGGYVPFSQRTQPTIGPAKDPARIKRLQEEADKAALEAKRANSLLNISKDTAKETGKNLFNFARDVTKGAAELALSGVEVNARALAPKAVPQSYDIPGLSKFTGPLKSFQTQASESVQAGASTGEAIGTGALNIATNEPLGVAFKPVFLGLGIASKAVKPAFEELAKSKIVSEAADILRKYFPKITPKAVEEAAPKIVATEDPAEIVKIVDQAAVTSKEGGGVPGNTGLKKVGLASEASPVVSKTEDTLLKKQIRDEARGSSAGYKAGYTDAKESITNQLKNTFETKVTKIVRANELDKLKTNIIANDATRVKGEIVDFVKNNIPAAERGRYLVTVSKAKTQRDLINAFVKIDARASQIVLDDSISSLKATAEKLSESPSVSADYRTKIKDIINQYELTGHNSATIAKLEATQAYLNRAEAAGAEVTLPKRILDKLEILARTPKDQLTLSRVQQLQNEIKTLGALGETKWRTKEALYEGEKAMRKEELLKTATPINVATAGKRAIGEEPKVWVDRFIKLRNNLTKSRVGMRTVDGFAEITGMTPMKQTLDVNFGAYLDRAIPGVSGFRKLEADMLENGGALTVGQRERVGVYGHKLQQDGYEKLANLGITKAEADAIVLTPEEQKFYDSIQQFNDSTFEQVRKYSQDVYNVDVGRVENYMSYQTDFEAISDLEAYDRFGDRTGEALAHRTKTVEKSFTQKRTGAGNQKVQIDAFKIAQRHADDVAYMLTMGRDIKQYSEIMNSPEILGKLGEIATLGWREYMDLLARKGGTASSQRIAAVDILRKNLGVGVLGFRLSSAAIQVTSFADSIATIGIEHATNGAAKIAVSKEWRSFVMDNFPEIRAAVGDDAAFRDFGSDFLGKAQKLGMQPLVAIDGVMRSSAAAGAYAKLAGERGIAINLANPDKTLIKDATKLMRDSQGSSFFKDQPLALSTGFGVAGNKSWNKLIFTFQSFMLNRWENIERQIWRLGIQEGNYAKAAMSATWLLVFSAMAEEAIRTGVSATTDAITGKESKPRDFAGNSIMNDIQSVPLLGNLVSSLSYSSNPVPVINTIETGLSGVTSVINGKALNTKIRGALQTVGAVGALSGIPGASQAAQLLRDATPPATGGGSSSAKKGGLAF